MKQTIKEMLKEQGAKSDVKYFFNHESEMAAFYESCSEKYYQTKWNDLTTDDSLESKYFAKDRLSDLVEYFKRCTTTKKFRIFRNKSKISESVYYNFEILDQEKKEEFHECLGYESGYSIRKSNHKRPPIMYGIVPYEHSYLKQVSTSQEFMNAKRKLEKLLKAYTSSKITIDELENEFDEF